MLLDLAKTLSFILSMISLYPVMMCAFFVPGAQWRERLETALLYIVLAGSVSIVSGLLFSLPSPANPRGEVLTSTLPVRLFLWTLVAGAALFALSSYLEDNFVPFMQHDCCRP